MEDQKEKDSGPKPHSKAETVASVNLGSGPRLIPWDISCGIFPHRSVSPEGTPYPSIYPTQQVRSGLTRDWQELTSGTAKVLGHRENVTCPRPQSQ